MMRERTPYGMTMLALNGEHFPDELVKAVADLGVSTVNLQMPWQRTETAPGAFAWQDVDANIQTLNRHGLNVMFCLLGPPEFACGVLATNKKRVIDPASATRYATAIAHRYGPGSQYGACIGLYLNEEYDDADPSNAASNNGGYAADVLNSLYPAVIAINPDWRIGCAAHFKVGRNHVKTWHEQLYTGGGVSKSGGLKPGMTIFSNFHFYRGNATPPDKQDALLCNFAEMWQIIHAVDVANGHPERELRCTEVGWEATELGDDATISYAQQASNLVYCLQQARESGVMSGVDLYTAAYGDNNSIIRQGTPLVLTPAYAAIQAEIAAHPQWTINPPTRTVPPPGTT